MRKFTNKHKKKQKPQLNSLSVDWGNVSVDMEPDAKKKALVFSFQFKTRFVCARLLFLCLVGIVVGRMTLRFSHDAEIMEESGHHIAKIERK